MSIYNDLDIIIQQRTGSKKEYDETRDRIARYLHDEFIVLNDNEIAILDEWEEMEMSI